MTLHAANPLDAFNWTTQPQASEFLRPIVAGFIKSCPAAAILAQRMTDETGTRFYDWIDTIVLPVDDGIRTRLAAAGYEKYPGASGDFGVVFHQPHGIFPRIVLDENLAAANVMIKVESVADFASVWHLPSSNIEGEPLARMRRLRVSSTEFNALFVVERHGYTGYEIAEPDAGRGLAMLRTLEMFRTRVRDVDDDADGYDHTNALIDRAIAEVGVHLACDLFFAAEREYWQRRNRAAQVQKARQDKLGLGWANHDHHTYRCSRENFARLVATWEKLGFHCRERFYAGREAGWGAQVMEQHTTGITTFNDVDLTPDELMGDFSHDGLRPQSHLGTVGLWCALHGDSFNAAGMHHLEAQFDFESLRAQLERDEAIKTMKPFTDYPHLRQAFTEGERWTVNPKRIDRLLAEKLITAEQANQFRTNGAIGSHLENLERNDGFKGFNQKGVSEIIADTDPRKHVGR